MLPLAIGREATVASSVQDAFRMEACKLVKTHLICRMLVTEDATTLATVMATLEEAEWLLAAGCRANRCGTIRLPVVAGDGTSNRRHGRVIVQALQILVSNLRDWRSRTVISSALVTVDNPAVVGGAHTGVDLWRGLAGGLFGSAQCRWDADGRSRLVDALRTTRRELCGAG